MSVALNNIQSVDRGEDEKVSLLALNSNNNLQIICRLQHDRHVLFKDIYQ